MPSKSDKRQRFFKWVQAVQNGSAKKKDATKSVVDAAKNMTKKQVSVFADIEDEWETTDLIDYTSNCCYVLIPL